MKSTAPIYFIAFVIVAAAVCLVLPIIFTT
jgi:hypothetical protein